VVGGIVKHLGALTAIGSSTVNSYRRLWDTGFWAPVFADWGYQNRTTGLRISAPGRFEYRSVDSMVNPHLMAAAILKAADDGIEPALAEGDFAPLYAWLRPNVHEQGSRYGTGDLLERATGRPLDAVAFKAHLKARYL
jgi:glutamine synthetase